jgi:hypothetical protein
MHEHNPNAEGDIRRNEQDDEQRLEFLKQPRPTELPKW